MLRGSLRNVIWLFLLPGLASGQGLPAASPSSVGLSDARLDRLDRVVQGYVDRAEIAGAVALVARRGGQAHLRAFGELDSDDAVQMPTNAIFRIASMTKPITSVAVLMLYEEGHFRLVDPIADYLPELSDLEVVRASDDGPDSFDLVPAARPVTIRHLLTHTSGISYRFLGSPLAGPSPAQRFVSRTYADAGIGDGLAEHPGTLAELVASLGDVPLLTQPGTAFTYGLGDDVLARLVEVVSGQRFDAFLRDRIFEPLGMLDTGFHVPAADVGRLASVYSPGPAGLTEVDGTAGDDLLVYSSTYSTDAERSFFSGGGGLTSTAQDYSRFAQMLLNRGELEGVRLLSPVTVDLMTANHIGSLAPSGIVAPGSGGFGLGVSVAAAPNEVGDLQGSEGAYGWSGFFNTTFWVDPDEELVGIVMTQLFPNPTDLQAQFRVMTYQAIVNQ